MLIHDIVYASSFHDMVGGVGTVYVTCGNSTSSTTPNSETRSSALSNDFSEESLNVITGETTVISNTQRTTTEIFSSPQKSTSVALEKETCKTSYTFLIKENDARY